MQITRDNIAELLSSYQIKPDKSLGQNFLVNPSIAEKIVSLLDVQEDDTIVEVGAGLGSLTHYLDAYPNGITLVDIDSNVVGFLHLNYKHHNIDIINSDIRDYDISKFTKVISNLPYSYTSDILIYLLKNAKNASKFVLMCENEAYLRISATEGKNYGPLNIFIYLVGDIHKEFDVEARNFYPIPKCGSTVFTLDLNKQIERDKAFGVYNMCKQLFINRRKTIYNNLKNYLKDDLRASRILEDLGIFLSSRPEQISPSDYVRLYERVK
ncbi:MAG: 16S rRNA (adenine(1518)-N(6)/adenine(1519)-N(6))-dimethyltransferase RsmA [Coprobacillus sp.]|nr:16S rRNA (adenine(1518)-N(6)/adenine(1519)-N(6))-dimethyltransferase RsmA [Coprobacillus sp.]